LIGFADDPGWCIGHTQVQYLAPLDHVVQALHELGNPGTEVPPVYIEQVDIFCLQLLERGLEGDFQGLGGIASVVDLLSGSVTRVREAGSELCGEHDFVAVFP
jgi:hypothetical protein